MNVLVISDIHANFPALESIINSFEEHFDLILNGGDSTVYGPFPNETIDWLQDNQALSILGNTDRHIIELLHGRTFKKPRKPEKRIMYGWTSAELSSKNRNWLVNQPLYRHLQLENYGQQLLAPLSLGLYHGSPDDPDEFLFRDGPVARFRTLAKASPHQIIITGHSHTPYYKFIDGVHFINPGSVGRMFDGNPAASCATIQISRDQIKVCHFRVAYDLERLINKLETLRFPSIYSTMYRTGRKLN